MIKIEVFQYGRYDGQTDKVVPTAKQWATREKIDALQAEPIGEEIEVDTSSVVDGYWHKKR